MPVMDMRSKNIMQHNYVNLQPTAMQQQQQMMGEGNCPANARWPICNAKLHSPSNGMTTFGGGLHPPVVGLPPKSPVYAVVNKASKRKISRQTDDDNVANVSSPEHRADIERYNKAW